MHPVTFKESAGVGAGALSYLREVSVARLLATLTGRNR